MVVSHVKTSARPEKEKESTETKADSGRKCQGWFAKLDPDSYSWKIPQCSLFGDLDQFCETWPRWGIMLDGECFQLPMLEHDTSVKESGSLPTPRASQGFTNPSLGKTRNDCLTTKILGKPILGMRPNPEFVEWMMDWPIGWSGLKELATDKFRQWLNSHGKP